MWTLLALALVATPRIVTVGGGVTETVFALGHGAEVVAVDSSSVFPEAALRLPQVGYQRQLSAEGVLAQRPTLVVLSADAGPPAAVAQLKASGVPLVIVADGHSLDGARQKVTTIAAALGTPERAGPVLQKLDVDVATAAPVVARNRARPVRVLFVYSRGGASVQVAGSDTAADAMVALAGGVNAINAFSGYRPLTAEGAVLAQPDVILLPARGLAASGGVDGVLALPGLKDTPAGRARRVIAVDDLLLLGFTPRVGEGIGALAQQLAAAQAKP